MSNHTPGPWKVTAYEPRNKVIANYGQGRQPVYFDVALCCDVVRGSVQANAQLIAAAPDMLAALKCCAHALALTYDSSEDNEYNHPIMQGISNALEAARKVIWAVEHTQVQSQENR